MNLARERDAYYNAKYRCRNSNHPQWRDYGGRGIELRFVDFASFIEAVGPKPSPDHSLDRIDNDGHYEAGNVKWSTRHEQVHNRRPLTRHGAYKKKRGPGRPRLSAYQKKLKRGRERRRLKSLTPRERRVSRCFSGKQ